MRDVLKGRPEATPPRKSGDGPPLRCVVCGKSFVDRGADDSWHADRRLCFWCAYVEPQG